MVYTQVYLDSLKEGREFEEYCYRWIEVHKRTRITPCHTRDEQNNVGENYFGLEIKLDKMFRTTRRLYIELRERSRVQYNYTDAGIFRRDNSFLYAVGDREILYVFSKNSLRLFYEQARVSLEAWNQRGRIRSEDPGYRIVENNLKTSWGWLLPIYQVERYQLAADIWKLCPVSSDEINAARGFNVAVIGTTSLSTKRKKKAVASGQMQLFQAM